MANVTQGAPPATITGEYKGLRCWQISSAAAGAGFAQWFTHRLNIGRNARSYSYGLDDSAVIETRWLMAFDRPAGDLNDARDLGVGISPGNNNQNMNNPAVGAVWRAGVQFGPGGPGKLLFRSRVGQSIVGPPAYFDSFTSGRVAQAGYDEREWHWYAIRMVGAAGGTNGFCKALLDGVLFSQFDMSDTAALFPNAQAGIGGAFNYLAGFTNATNAEFDKLYVARGELLIAPDETSLI